MNPSKIILGGEEIEIKFFDAFEQRNNDNKGYYNSEFQVIGIAANQKPLTMANTFLHEVIHAIIRSNNFIEVIKNVSDGDSLDEIIAHQLSSDLQEFFVVNQEAFEWYASLLSHRHRENWKDEAFNKAMQKIHNGETQ